MEPPRRPLPKTKKRRVDRSLFGGAEDSFDKFIDREAEVSGEEGSSDEDSEDVDETFKEFLDEDGGPLERISKKEQARIGREMDQGDVNRVTAEGDESARRALQRSQQQAQLLQKYDKVGKLMNESMDLFEDVEDEDNKAFDLFNEAMDFEVDPFASAKVSPPVLEASGKAGKHELLFYVKTQNCKDHECVIHLMRRMQKKILQGWPASITAVYASELLQGYVYIEGTSKEAVQEALRGCRYVSYLSLGEVRPEEINAGIFQIDQVLTQRVTNPVRTLHKGDWVRMKTQEYQGDLGQIHGFLGKNLIVRVRARLDNYMTRGATAVHSRQPPRVIHQAKLPKYLQVHEDPNEEHVWTCGEHRFYKCHLLKEVAPNQVMKGARCNTNPAEIAEFRGHIDEDDFSQALNREVDTNVLAAGDRCICISGDLKGVVGVVGNLLEGGKTVSMAVEIDGNQSDNLSRFEYVQVPRKTVCKYFVVGDHVKVVGTNRMHENGLVTKADYKYGVFQMISASTKDIFEVSVHDIELVNSSRSKSSAENVVSANGLRSGDMVKLGNTKQMGMITRFNSANTAMILYRSGQSGIVPVHDIIGKLKSSKDCLDKEANRLICGTAKRPFLVKIMSSNLIGNIVHIHLNTLFIKLSENSVDGRFKVVDCKEVLAHMGKPSRV